MTTPKVEPYTVDEALDLAELGWCDAGDRLSATLRAYAAQQAALAEAVGLLEMLADFAKRSGLPESCNTVWAADKALAFIAKHKKGE